MVAYNIQFGQGITLGSGIGIGQVGPYYNRTTIPAVQNVSGSDGAVGFFFTGSWSALTGVPNLNDVQPGWLVDQIPGATVVSTDAGTQTITITGGAFVSGSFYTFTGI